MIISEELARPMIHSMNLLSGKNADLLAEARQYGIDVNQQLTFLKDINHIVFTSCDYPKHYCENKLKEKIWSLHKLHTMLEDTIRDHQAIVPVPPPLPAPLPEPVPLSNRPIFVLGLTECSAEDARISELYLNEWIARAKEKNVNIQVTLTKIDEMKNMIYSEENSDVSDEVKLSAYAHHTNLYCNDIILQVLKEEIRRLADKGRNHPDLQKKRGFVNHAEREFINALPKKRSFEPPALFEAKCRQAMLPLPNRINKIFDYQLPK